MIDFIFERVRGFEIYNYYGRLVMDVGVVKVWEIVENYYYCFFIMI